MEIKVAASAGFCFGVKRAVELVEKLVSEGKKVCTLGAIIHNPQKVQELAEKGVRIVDTIDEVQPEETLVIRSHGVGPEVYREAEERLLKHLFEEQGEPVVLTVKAVASPHQHQFFKHVGMMKMPVTWADYQQNDYVVYAKGKFEMGGFVNLMERVEYKGKEIVYKDEDGILIS